MFHDPEHGPLWNACNQAVWIIGSAYLAALVVALLLYLPDVKAAAWDGQQQVALEHSDICDKLRKTVDAPGRADCLNVLLNLQRKHEELFVARTRGLL
jgi:hypothetical protein